VYQDTTQIQQYYTNSTGNITMTLPAGTYTLRLYKALTTFQSAITLDIDDDRDVTYIGTTYSIPVPTEGTYCVVYAYCFDLASQEPLESITSYAKIVSLPYNYDGKLHEKARIEGIYNSETGLVYWNIVQGATIEVYIKEVGLYMTKAVPEQSHCLLVE